MADNTADDTYLEITGSFDNLNPCYWRKYFDRYLRNSKRSSISIQLKNIELVMELDDEKSQILALKLDRNQQMNDIIRSQRDVKFDFFGRRSNMN